MSQIHFVGVFVRLFAIYLGLGTVYMVAMLIFYTPDWNIADARTASMAIIAGLSLLLAVALWVFNLSVARRLFHGNAGERALDLEGTGRIELALFSFTGLWLVCRGLIDGVYWAGVLQFMRTQDWDVPLPPETKAGMLCTAAELILGLVLVLGSQGLVRMLAKFRGRD